MADMISNEMSQSSFLYLLNQAIDEINDLQDAVDYDEEFMQDSLIFIEPIKQELLFIKQKIDANDITICEQDFKFMALINKISTTILPCKNILIRVNNAVVSLNKTQ